MTLRLPRRSRAPAWFAGPAALLPLLLLPAVAPSEDKPIPGHLEWAIKLVDDLRPEDTSYSHAAPYVRWKGVDGAEKTECRTDCSGLLDALLARAYGYSEDTFKGWLGRKRPLAKAYHDAIVDGKRFKQIDRVQDAAPGDILAIKYRPDDPRDKGHDTGHVMIVFAAPTPRRATKPVVDGTEQWDVTVIDESASYHGKTDTRHRDDGTKGSGAGRGVFRIYADKDGKVMGHAWSQEASSEYHDQADRDLVIGRLDP